MKTVDEIYEEMSKVYSEMTGVPLNDRGDMAVRLYAAADQIFSLYVYSDWVKRQAFPQTAQDEQLDYHAQLRGLTRAEAFRAQGILRFSLQEAKSDAVKIPAGTVCMTAALVSFETTADAVIEPGGLYSDAPAHASEAGTGGNVSAETVIYMTSAPLGVKSCTNPSHFSGGLAAEDDETLRSRVLSTYERLPNGTNVAFYESEVLNIPNVAAVNVIPRARGIGTIDIVVSASGGAPSAELLEEIKSHLDKIREICVDIQVLAPTHRDVLLDISIAAGDNDDYGYVKAKVQSALEDYFSGQILGEDILLAKIGSIVYSIGGVKNYRVNSPSSDLTVASGELPRLTGLVITEMEA